MKPFFLSVLSVFAFALALDASAASAIYVEGTNYGAGPAWYSTPAELCDVLESKAQSGKTTYPCELTPIDYRQVRIDGTLYYNKRYMRAVIPVAGASNPTTYYYEFDEDPRPSCDAPSYIENGECVEPEQICYTTFEDMADECVLIGEDDPNDEVPQGCVVNASGKEICLTEDPGCYAVNGFTYCPNPAEVCGMKNGAFSCVNPEEEGCGYFNGEKVCIDPSGQKVENDSPDHPDNGGNLDGNEENDMMDPRDETEGGDPNNQPDGGVIEPTTDADRATEKTSREQLQELKKLNKTLEQMGSGSLPDSNGPADKIDAAKNGLIAETGIDGVIDGIGSNPFGSGDLSGVSGVAGSLIPQGTCVGYSQDILGFGTFEITCDDTALLRTILAWVLYVLTAIYLFQLVTTPVGSKD